MMENEKIKESNYNFSIFMGLGLTFGIVFDKLALGISLWWLLFYYFREKIIKLNNYRNSI